MKIQHRGNESPSLATIQALGWVWLGVLPLRCVVAGVCVAAGWTSPFSQGCLSECVLLVLKGGCPLSGQQGLPPQPAALLGPLQPSRREIFTAPHHKGFCQGMTWRIYGPLMLLPDCCLGTEATDGVEVLFMEWLTVTKLSDFGRSCLSLAGWQCQGFGALCLLISQSLGRETETCGPTHRAFPWERGLQPGWHLHSPASPQLLPSSHHTPIHRGAKAQKWLKCRNISHQYSAFFRTGDRQAGRPSARSPCTFPSHICKNHCYRGRNHKDLSLPQVEHL